MNGTIGDKMLVQRSLLCLVVLVFCLATTEKKSDAGIIYQVERIFAVESTTHIGSPVLGEIRLSGTIMLPNYGVFSTSPMSNPLMAWDLTLSHSEGLESDLGYDMSNSFWIFNGVTITADASEVVFDYTDGEFILANRDSLSTFFRYSDLGANPEATIRMNPDDNELRLEAAPTFATSRTPFGRVPEPASLAVFGLLFGTAFYRTRRR